MSWVHMGASMSDGDAPSITPRLRGRKGSAIRARFLRQHPRCAVCSAPAVAVDHVQPLALGGRNHASNKQALCDDCHAAKTRADRAAIRAAKYARIREMPKA
jgi:5-methylcytosine-specific restriction protein A